MIPGSLRAAGASWSCVMVASFNQTRLRPQRGLRPSRDFDSCAVNTHNVHMKRRLTKSTGVRARRAGRKRKLRPATVRRKNLLLDQDKLDLLRGSLGVATDQEAVERVIDEAVIDRELIDATLALGGTLAGMVDVGRRR